MRRRKLARGLPDYGIAAPKEVTGGTSDLGEVAARLGSIVTYDRRGDVVDFDNFDNSVLKWITDLQGTGAYVRLDSTSVKSGSQAVRLHTPNELAAHAYMSKYIPLLGQKSLGLETSFSYLSSDVTLRVTFWYYNGTQYAVASYRIDIAENNLSILLSDNTWEVITTDIAELNFYHCFHTVKIVADFDTGKYKRVLIDDAEYDMSDKSMRIAASVTTRRLAITVQISNKVDTGGDVWIDDIIWTLGEP